MTTTLQNIQINDRGIALNPVTGETFRLAGSALQLVRKLKEGARPDELLQCLLDEFEVDEATARRDLDAFLASLERLNWVEAAS
jgi:PqqD family protein of HPr-rel-A system